MTPTTDGTAPDAEYIREHGPGPLHVWRRSDGYAGWTRGANPPRGWTANGRRIDFEVLATTYDENAAREILGRARAGDGRE